MSPSSPPSSDQHTTVFETPQRALANISPTNSSTDTQQKKATENCIWEDIFVSAESTNPCVRKPSKNAPVASVPCSRLVSIRNIPTVALKLNDLQKLGARLGVPNSRRLCKYDLCNVIVAAKG